MNSISRFAAAVCAAAIALAATSYVAAQSYPAKPVRMIAPFPPGGGVDASARIIAQALSDRYVGKSLGVQLANPLVGIGNGNDVLGTPPVSIASDSSRILSKGM